jgi:hypothetical protein
MSKPQFHSGFTPGVCSVMCNEGETMYSVKGGCHCGNISYVAEFTKKLSEYTPRACDCTLCTGHGASYASDRNGTLKININNEDDISKYRQGSRIAEFLICKICGIMTGVCYEENGCVYGSINVRSACEHAAFGYNQIAQLEQLSDEDRIKRWKKYWFRNVLINYENR